MSELDDLIAAVESGTFVCNDALSPRANENVAYRAFSGSLDAALALHEALLPGYFIDFKWWTSMNGGAIVTVGNRYEGKASTPARAWLLAILRAYRQQRGAGNEPHCNADIWVRSREGHGNRPPGVGGAL